MAAQPVRTMSVTKESGSSEETLGLTDADSRVELVASAPSKAAEAPEIQPWAAISGSQLFWTLFSGLMFGFALQKAGVGNAQVIMNQFSFRDNTMLVMFLTASATSALAIGAMKAASKSSREAAEAAGAKYLKSQTMGAVAVGIGGILIGAGMSMAGTCPGTIWAQLGAGQPKTLITFAGAIVGAAIIALTHHRIRPMLELIAPESRTVASILGMSTLASSALVAGVFAAVVAVVLAVPGFYKPLPGAADIFGYEHWHPVIGGILVGLVQVPLTLGVGKNLGASTSFSVIASNMMRSVGFVNDYTRPLVGGRAYWDILFVAFATAGAAFAALSGNTWYTWNEMPVTEAEAFVGGILLLIGARIASGCTSGHGITGVGHGSLISMVGVAGIFVGGIAVSLAYGRW